MRSAEHLRTLRLPNTMGFVDVAASQGVAGYQAGDNGSYPHLGASSAELMLRASEPTSPRSASANASLSAFEYTAQGPR